MPQYLLMGIAIILFLGGVKGFTASGIPLSKNKQLRGAPGMIAGAAIIAAALVAMWAALAANGIA
ncbi:MAG: hypothetical protein O3B01_01910 [Planctomycetota bacterium]|nr:hypothetical protein [Planctomycetota bacterium]MDA1137312.1 hypothetical protein [Planctomycetota bacterium]